MVDHPFAQSVVRSLEHTLLPDEAMLQTIAINSPFRRTLIPVHLRFIEWPQSHGDANKYWASVGPQFHGGPMVLNATLGREKAFKQSGMFARKVDPGLYRDVLDEWDKWRGMWNSGWPTRCSPACNRVHPACTRIYPVCNHLVGGWTTRCSPASCPTASRKSPPPT
jgi:hypothetical protein